jgi:hypothetical protein
MEQDLVNAEISGEDKTSIDTSIAAIQGKLPFLVSLSPKEILLFKLERTTTLYSKSSPGYK